MNIEKDILKKLIIEYFLTNKEKLSDHVIEHLKEKLLPKNVIKNCLNELENEGVLIADHEIFKNIDEAYYEINPLYLKSKKLAKTNRKIGVFENKKHTKMKKFEDYQMDSNDN